VRVSEEIGLVIGVAICREGLAQAYTRLGRYGEALALAEQALVVTVEHALMQQQVEAMTAIGDIYRCQGHFADAARQHTAALALCRDIDDPALWALVLKHLGETHLGVGDHDNAASSFERALECVDRGGDRIERARILIGLGDAYAMAGGRARAREYWTQAQQAIPADCLAMASRVQQRLARIDG
jgi:tetratricopeptide (TPR) repeat protein